MHFLKILEPCRLQSFHVDFRTGFQDGVGDLSKTAKMSARILRALFLLDFTLTPRTLATA